MLAPGYYLSLKIPLWWKQLNHTNRSSSIMKLGCVPYEKCLYVITLRDSVWSGTDWVR